MEEVTKMKHLFINKKTGAEARVIAIYLDSDGVMQVDSYDAVEDLMDDYAAYEKYEPPKEPLIKDEDKLDTVKSFFTLLGITNGIYYQSLSNSFWHTDDDGITYSIDFDDNKGIDNIDTDRAYALNELCGEEEG